MPDDDGDIRGSGGVCAHDPKPECGNRAWAASLALLPLVRKIAGDFVSPVLDFDDLVQEGLIEAQRVFGGYCPEHGPFGAYAGTSIRNRFIDLANAMNRGARSGNHSRGAFVPDRLDRVDEAELAGVLDAMRRLSARDRAIIRSHFGLDGDLRQTSDEVGEGHGLSGPNTRQRKCRALSRLRVILGVE